MTARSFELAVIACIAFIGLASATSWLVTVSASWPAVLLERAVTLKEKVPQASLLSVWEKSRYLDTALLPGPHLHLPGLAGQQLLEGASLSHEYRAEVIQEAEQATRSALLRDPATPRSWARLAWFQQLRQGSPYGILDAVRMSAFLAPSDRGLVFWRLTTAAAYRPYWDAEFEGMLRQQVLIAWRISPSRLAAVAKAARLHEWIRSVLDADSEALTRYDQEFAKML